MRDGKDVRENDIRKSVDSNPPPTVRSGTVLCTLTTWSQTLALTPPLPPSPPLALLSLQLISSSLTGGGSERGKGGGGGGQKKTGAVSFGPCLRHSVQAEPSAIDLMSREGSASFKVNFLPLILSPLSGTAVRGSVRYYSTGLALPYVPFVAEACLLLSPPETRICVCVVTDRSQ